jgi:DNA-binding NarL/FixJ family response regulator
VLDLPRSIGTVKDYPGADFEVRKTGSAWGGTLRSKDSGIPTYIVTTNRLAGEYLVQLLASDRFARPILCEQLPQPRLRSMPAVFIVEGSLVPIPLREFIRRLRSLFPKGRFLMVNTPQPDEEIIHLIKLGFHGFIEHSKVVESLAAGVRAIATGRLWIPDGLMHRYLREADEAREGSADRPQPPTFRETEVLELIRQRLSNREIATILSVSVSTVKYHVSHILAKCRVASRHELEATSIVGPTRIWEQLSKSGPR